MDNLEIDYKKASQQLRSGEALFSKVVRNRYCNITTHRANYQQIEVYVFLQWLPLPPLNPNRSLEKIAFILS